MPPSKINNGPVLQQGVQENQCGTASTVEEGRDGWTRHLLTLNEEKKSVQLADLKSYWMMS